MWDWSLRGQASVTEPEALFSGWILQLTGSKEQSKIHTPLSHSYGTGQLGDSLDRQLCRTPTFTPGFAGTKVGLKEWGVDNEHTLWQWTCPRAAFLLCTWGKEAEAVVHGSEQTAREHASITISEGSISYLHPGRLVLLGSLSSQMLYIVSTTYK